MECKCKDQFCLPERDFLKGRPKFPNGISKWKSAFQLLVFTSFGPFGLASIFREKVVEMERVHSTEKFHFEY